MAAMVDRINKETASNIVTIEDPIEYIFEPANSAVHQREVGYHVVGFAEGIRQAVKLSADVVMVGEVQDHETLLAALAAVENGCLVLATLHASSVAGALQEIVSLCPPDGVERTLRRLVLSLRVLMSQTLANRAHGKGRVPCLEILINNQAVAETIAARQFERLAEIMKRSRGLGMQTQDMALKALLAKNLISTEEALYRATDRDYMYSRSV
jgi:twitching motility protein PilT